MLLQESIIMSVSLSRYIVMILIHRPIFINVVVFCFLVVFFTPANSAKIWGVHFGVDPRCWGLQREERLS